MEYLWLITIAGIISPCIEITPAISKHLCRQSSPLLTTARQAINTRSRRLLSHAAQTRMVSITIIRSQLRNWLRDAVKYDLHSEATMTTYRKAGNSMSSVNSLEKCECSTYGCWPLQSWNRNNMIRDVCTFVREWQNVHTSKLSIILLANPAYRAVKKIPDPSENGFRHIRRA